jgi:hypothetical protein
MPKANFTLPNGTVIQIEGTVEDINALLAQFAGQSGHKGTTASKRKAKPRTSEGGKGTRKRATAGPVGLITELKDEGFFAERKKIGEVQKKLEEQGHIYATTSLSPALYMLTKKKVLRRLKEKDGWNYVASK